MSDEHQQYIPLTETELWAENYRHGDVEAIKTSIRRFGFNGVLKIWKDTVIAGNHAAKALLEMKAAGEKPPRNVLVGATGDWLIPHVDVSHLAWDEAQAFAIADNHTQELGTNDKARLAQLLTSISASNEALLETTGYRQAELDALLASIQKKTDDLSNAMYPPAPTQPLPLASGGVDSGASGGDFTTTSNVKTDIDPTNIPPSTVRMVQLFFNQQTHAEFLATINELMGVFDTDNVSDTVLEVVREAGNSRTERAA